MAAGWDDRQHVLDLMRGYRSAQVLITCTELGIFAALATGPADPVELARRIQVEPAALGRLLNSAVALGLLEKQDGSYANSAVAAACLAGEGPLYLGNLVKREGAFYRRWARLTEAVRTGERPPANQADEANPNWVREFELALYDIARSSAPATAAALAPLVPQRAGQPCRVIDVGGGHGAYSIALAQHYDQVEAVVFELPAAAAVAQPIVASAQLGRRVTVQPGDFKIDDLGHDYDLALLFGILVSEPPAEMDALLRKVLAALVPGGAVVIRGLYLDQARSSPLEATLFDLQMLLSTRAGTAHTRREITEALITAGFEDDHILRTLAPDHADLLIARKPTKV